MAKHIEVTIYDPSHDHALLHIDWTGIAKNGPMFLRCSLLRYDAEGLLWIGVVLDMPVLANLRDESIIIGGERYTANLRQLEAFIA